MAHKYDIDPDDHGAYMVRCSRCGQQYHCTDAHECPAWLNHDDYDEPLDERWGEGPEADNAAERYFDDLEVRRERDRG